MDTQQRRQEAIRAALDGNESDGEESAASEFGGWTEWCPNSFAAPISAPMAQQDEVYDPEEEEDEDDLYPNAQEVIYDNPGTSSTMKRNQTQSLRSKVIDEYAIEPIYDNPIAALTFPETPDNSTILEGWMLKQGGGLKTFSRKNWKKRFFRLTPQALTYHKQPEQPALNIIDISSIRSVSFEREIVPDKLVEVNFHIETPGRIFHCVGETPEQALSWVGALKKAKAMYGSVSADAVMLF